MGCVKSKESSGPALESKRKPQQPHIALQSRPKEGVKLVHKTVEAPVKVTCPDSDPPSEVESNLKELPEYKISDSNDTTAF